MILKIFICFLGYVFILQLKTSFLYCAVALSVTRFSFELSLKTSAQDFLWYALTQLDNKNYESFQ